MHLYKTFHSARFYLTFVPTVLCNFWVSVKTTNILVAHSTLYNLTFNHFMNLLPIFLILPFFDPCKPLVFRHSLHLPFPFLHSGSWGPWENNHTTVLTVVTTKPWLLRASG
jgi:hypothetical protein